MRCKARLLAKRKSACSASETYGSGYRLQALVGITIYMAASYHSLDFLSPFQNWWHQPHHLVNGVS